MRSQLFGHAAMLAILFSGAATPAAAQQPSEPVQPIQVEVTPFVALGSPLSSRIGTAVTFPLTDTVSIEAEVGYRRAEMNAMSLTASVLYDLPRMGRVTPYLAAGAGLEQYGTALARPDGSLATQGRTAAVVNAGGGLKVPVDNNWGLRTDARWFNGLGRQASEHWRVYNGVTLRTGGR